MTGGAAEFCCVFFTYVMFRLICSISEDEFFEVFEYGAAYFHILPDGGGYVMVTDIY